MREARSHVPGHERGRRPAGHRRQLRGRGPDHGRDRLAHEARDELQKLCNLYEIGIDVSQLIFQDINPPESVKPSFNEVNESLQEKERKINEAWAEYNNEIPKATGVAEQTIRGGRRLRHRAGQQRQGRRQPVHRRLSGIRPGALWSPASASTSKR